MLRTLEGDVSKVADIIPIDYCVNMLISVTWYTTIITWVSFSLFLVVLREMLRVYKCARVKLAVLEIID